MTEEIERSFEEAIESGTLTEKEIEKTEEKSKEYHERKGE